MARNTDDRQVWAAPGDADAPRWDVYGYADDMAALAEARGYVASWRRRDAGRVLRLVALAGAVVGLAGLMLAACILSYSSIHHLATQAGVSSRLASVYPLIFDALLVVAGCSVLALRGAVLVSRIYGWLSMLLLLGCLAAGGAIHAAAVSVPRHVAGVVAAIVPWALVLIGFGLLLTLLRYARVRHAEDPGRQTDLKDRASTASAVPAARYGRGAATESAGGASSESAVGTATDSERRASPDAPPVQAHEPNPAAEPNPGPEPNPAPISDDEAGDVPEFRRTRSSPTPPEE